MSFKLFLALCLVIVVAVIIYMLYRHHQNTKFNSIYLKGILQNTPFSAKNARFTFNQNGNITPYIPADIMPEINTQNTYSFWIFIDSNQWDFKLNDWKHILNRGDDMNYQLPNSYPVKFQSPGFWIPPLKNEIHCFISTQQTRESIQGEQQPAVNFETLTLKDIDLNQWINITVVINGNSATLYKNGMLESTRVFKDPIRINKDNVYIAQLDGFGGDLAFFQFIPRAINPDEVAQIYNTLIKPIRSYMNYLKSHPAQKSHTNVPRKSKLSCKKACDAVDGSTNEKNNLESDATNDEELSETELANIRTKLNI
jgi:hypothetical protein